MFVLTVSYNRAGSDIDGDVCRAESSRAGIAGCDVHYLGIRDRVESGEKAS